MKTTISADQARSGTIAHAQCAHGTGTAHEARGRALKAPVGRDDVFAALDLAHGITAPAISFGGAR